MDSFVQFLGVFAGCINIFSSLKQASNDNVQRKFNLQPTPGLKKKALVEVGGGSAHPFSTTLAYGVCDVLCVKLVSLSVIY